MQDVYSSRSSGGGGRLFAGEVDTRPRLHLHNLKCPRCQSFNTKFCYYNNYNMSQPRHFCKSCRRYWTKGGVLRNVPVGGGMRKNKRAGKPKSKASKAVVVEKNSSNDCSRTGKTMASATPTTTSEVSTSNPTNSTSETLLNINKPSSRLLSSPATTFDPLIMNQPSVRNMSLLITDQTAVMNYTGMENIRSNSEPDWQNSADEDLFDPTGIVNESYWCQNPWRDYDNEDHNNLNYLL